MKESYQVGGLERADIDMIHAKADQLLKKVAFKETDFVDPDGPYSEEAVGRDLSQVQRKEKEWKQRDTPEAVANKKLATIFEAVIFEHAELSEWLGSEAFTLKTSLFDDYENGVDAIVELRSDESSSYLGLAIDMTFSSDPNSSDGMTKKFDRIFSRIDSGTLTRIKYFHGKKGDEDIHGRLDDLPEVVIGADKATVLELAELWNGKKNNILAEHKIQIMMLLQIQAQLEVFFAYAIRQGKRDVAETFHDRLVIIEGILEKKKDLVKKVGNNLGTDSVHYAMMNYLEHKKREVVGMKAAE